MIENQELTKDLFLKYNLQMIDTEKLAQKYSTASKKYLCASRLLANFKLSEIIFSAL